MQSLIFELTTDKKCEIKEEIPYFLHQNILHFKIENTLYEYDIENDIFKKRNQEFLILIRPKKKEMTVELLQNHYLFDFPLLDISLKKNSKKIEITYTFLNPEKTTNCIVIDYHEVSVEKVGRNFT